MSDGRRLRVRTARPGEGAAVAALWRELWDVHERWGGYRGSSDARVYAQLAAKLDDDARVRGGRCVLGRHAHLVAEIDGRLCGQVEGWLDRLGGPASPLTCEVRSLIVTAAARGLGAGRTLLEALANATHEFAHDAPCVMAAEVLEPNPARGFYGRVGYDAVSWAARVDTSRGAAAASPVVVRLAQPRDALALARLEAALGERRWSAGDTRFDRPSAADATFVSSIAAYVASALAAENARPGDPPPAGTLREPATLVAVDESGAVRGSASSAVQTLDPPFLPVRRALVGRFAVDRDYPVRPVVQALVAFACRQSASQGAQHAELTDLTAPGTELHDAALATGARAWSHLVTRAVR